MISLDYSIICLILALVCMIHLCWVDFHTYSIPDFSSVSLAVLGIGYRIILGSDLFFVLALAAMAGIFAFLLAIVFEKLLKRPALGYGDVKLLAAISIWISVSYFPLFLIFTGLFALMLSLILRKKIIPLAPALGMSWGLSFFF